MSKDNDHRGDPPQALGFLRYQGENNVRRCSVRTYLQPLNMAICFKQYAHVKRDVYTLGRDLKCDDKIEGEPVYMPSSTSQQRVPSSREESKCH
jgi:hypothetical protein